VRKPVILAIHALQRAPRKKDRPASGRAGNTRFLSSMQERGVYDRSIPGEAETLSSSCAVRAAAPGAERAAAAVRLQRIKRPFNRCQFILSCIHRKVFNGGGRDI